MRTTRLIVLAIVVAGLGAFIWFYERHQPTTEEAMKRQDKVFPTLERDRVRAVVVRNEHGAFRLERRGEDEWRLTRPAEYPAERSAVNGLLSALENLKVERRLPAGEVDLAAYGLDHPSLEAILELDDGTQLPLRVGGETALGSDRAVTVDGREVLLVPKWFASDLEKDLDGWRSHDVVDVYTDQVASLEIEAGSDRIQVVKDGDLWKLLEPVRDLADRDHVQALITALNGLRVEEFVDDPEAAGDLGLDHPRYRVKIVRTEGKAPVVLEFGRKREAEGKTLVACRRDGSEVFWVGDAAETPLGKAPVLWRSKVVFPFDTWDVQALVVAPAKGESVRIERREGVWRCGDHDADSTAVYQRLNKLARLEANGYDLAEAGTPELGKITLELGDADTPPEKRRKITFTFHAPMARGGDALVVVNARKVRMSVSADDARALLEDPARLCGGSPTPTPTPAPTATPAAG